MQHKGPGGIGSRPAPTISRGLSPPGFGLSAARFPCPVAGMHFPPLARLASAACFLAGCFSSCSRAADEKLEQRLPGSVWVVENSTGGRLYLCGTIHILRDEDYPLAPAYEAAYADSEKLVFELPPGSSGASLNEKIQAVGFLPEGQSLKSSVPADVWEKLAGWAGSRGLAARDLERFRPWHAALVIATIEYAALGAEADKGVDNHFEKRAKADSKPCEGLETVDLQLGLFTQLKADMQLDLLSQTLGEIKTLPDEFEKMIKAWKEGDLETLREILYREAERYPQLMDLFLHNRNKAWMDRLEPMLKKNERVMVLVGTGHFAGKQGLVEMMKAKGFQVRLYRNHQAAKAGAEQR